MKAINKISSRVVKSILSDYNFGAIKSYEKISEGTVQENILIRTTNESVVLKYYKSRKIEYVEFEIKLLEYLNEKGYCSPEIYKNKQGNLFTIRFGKAIVITKYIEGEHQENLSKYEFEQLITKIAELHRLTESLKLDGFENRWNYNIDFCKDYLIERTESFRNARQMKKKAWLERELDQLHISNSIPKGIIHGDLHYTNIFFLRNEMKGLIDFDDANYSYLLYDIICLIDSRRAEDSFLNQEYFHVSKEVINKYQRIRKLQEEEKRSLFDILLLSIIIDSFWYYKRGKFPDFKEKNKIELLKKMGRNKFYDSIFK